MQTRYIIPEMCLSVGPYNVCYESIKTNKRKMVHGRIAQSLHWALQLMIYQKQPHSHNFNDDTRGHRAKCDELNRSSGFTMAGRRAESVNDAAVIRPEVVALCQGSGSRCSVDVKPKRSI
jgi:hypothetical protein